MQRISSLVLAVIGLVSLIECWDQPVLSRLSTGPAPRTALGNLVDEAKFKDELSMSLPGLAKTGLDVILVGGARMTSDKFADEIRRFELETNVMFHSQVDSAYQNLVEFLNTHKHIKANEIDVANLNHGLIKFVACN